MNRLQLSRYSLRTGLMAIFFLALICIGVWINLKRPAVLILHSYNPEYVWTRDINEGIQRVLNEHGWLNVQYHYMETKKNNSKEHLRRAGIAARNAIDQLQPDIVVAFDDYAQKLAAKNYVNTDDIKIVFAGINGSARPYGYEDASNVTGILERKPVRALKEVLTYIQQQRDTTDSMRVRFLADTTYSARRDAEYIDSYEWNPITWQAARFVGDFEAWKAAVLAMGAETDLLLVGAYRKLKRAPGHKEYVSPKEVMTWTSTHSPIPVIGMNVFNTQDGAPLSIGVSPYEQGEVAASMAIALLQGKPIKDIPIQTSQQYIVSMRQGSMHQRGMQLPPIYEAFAKATNNFFD